MKPHPEVYGTLFAIKVSNCIFNPEKKSMVGVMWWRKSQRRNIPREKKKLFIHFVFRHNIISIQILSKCWGYSYLLMLSFLMDRFEGHFPHHPAFSTLISGFRSLKFYWLYKTVVHHIAFFSIHNSKELLPTNTIHIDTLYPFVILFSEYRATKSMVLV